MSLKALLGLSDSKPPSPTNDLVPSGAPTGVATGLSPTASATDSGTDGGVDHAARAEVARLQEAVRKLERQLEDSAERESAMAAEANRLRADVEQFMSEAR